MQVSSMNKAYIFKLRHGPRTLEQACRVRYYIRVCAHTAILRAIEDLNLSIERVLFNCEMVSQPPVLDCERHTVYDELQEITALLRTPIYEFIAGAASQMPSDVVLNINATVYNRDQLLLSHEVYRS